MEYNLKSVAIVKKNHRREFQNLDLAHGGKVMVNIVACRIQVLSFNITVSQ